MASAPIILTMGEPAGIGAEMSLKAWLRRAEGVPPFALIDDPERLAALSRQLGWAVPIRTIDTMREATDCWDEAFPVLRCQLNGAVVAGRPNIAHAPAVIAAIERAVELVTRGDAAAVVTNPIHKHILADAGFPYPGHTEFLAFLAGGATPVMMLACPGLRVVPITVHCSLAQAVIRIDRNSIVTAGRIIASALRRDFGISSPRLAVAALNPHAGEGGLFGREEIEIITPAIAQLRNEGIDVFGPAPADTLFHGAARQHYDAALCMYHDQALIPLKTIDFARGVNITLGLPFIRTSPDHGTAFDIAGTGTANPESLIAALMMAADAVTARLKILGR